MSDLPSSEPIGRWVNARNPERRCSAHKKSGDQCGNPARRGTTVCDFHGAKAPQVKAKARQRLDEAQDRMAKALLGIAEGAESEAVKLAAIKHVLAIGGLNEKTSLEVTAQLKPYEEAFAAATIAPMTREEHQAARVERGLPARVEPAADREFTARPGRTYDHEMEVVDAEVVEEPAARTAPVGGAARDSDDRADAASRRPAFAMGAVPPRPGKELMTMEDATAEAAAANRTADVHPVRKRNRR